MKDQRMKPSITAYFSAKRIRNIASYRAYDLAFYCSSY
jgi:hypothetical protein